MRGDERRREGGGEKDRESEREVCEREKNRGVRRRGG